MTRRQARWAGIAIITLAAALRLSLATTARFLGDEANDYTISRALATVERAPALGPPLTDGRARLPGPLYYWLSAAPLVVSRAPEAAYVFYELLGTATVAMFWLALRKPFGERAAAFAAALMALSPWSALFGDRMWNPHAFLFVEAVAFLAAAALRAQPDSRWAAFTLPLACLALPQMHMSAPVVWLALVPLVWPALRRANRRALVLGTVAGALLYLPYAIHELQTGMSNTRYLLTDTARQSSTPAHLRGLQALWAPVYALRFLTLDTTYHELMGYWGGLDERAAWSALWHGSPARPFHPLRLLALLGSGVLLALALAAVGRRMFEREREAPAGPRLGAFAWSAVVALTADTILLAFTGRRVFAHYVICVFPFLFVVYAALGRAALEPSAPSSRGRRAAAAAVLGLALLVAAGGIEATLSVSRRIDGRNGLGVIRAVTGRIFSDVAPAPSRAPVAADVQFGFPASTGPYAIFSRYALGRPLELRRGGNVPRYRLQKREDPAPAAAASAPLESIGPVDLYRLR
jgi:hypothetical protein